MNRQLEDHKDNFISAEFDKNPEFHFWMPMYPANYFG